MNTQEVHPQHTAKPTRTAPKLAVTLKRWILGGSETLLTVAAVLVFFLGFTSILVVSLPQGTGLRDLYGDLVSSQPLGSDVALGGQTRVFFAELVGTTRTVKDRPEHAVAWRTARTGQPLGNHHAVQTLARSGALIRFEGNSELKLGENSLVLLQQSENRYGMRRDRASLVVLGGEVRGRLPRSTAAEMPLEIMTAGATARLEPEGDEPAGFAVTVNPDESATLRMVAGTAEVTVNGETAVVQPEHALTIHPSQPLGRPERVPDPPRPLAPADGHARTFGTVAPPVEFLWSGSDELNDYRVVVARDPQLTDIVHDHTVPDPSFDLGNLTAGRYYWRVSGIRDRLESDPSEVRSFLLVQDLDAPELTVDLPRGVIDSGSLTIRGATEPGARVLIGGEVIPATESGEFEYVATLRHGPNLMVVEAVDAVGNVAYFSQYVNAKFPALKDRP